MSLAIAVAMSVAMAGSFVATAHAAAAGAAGSSKAVERCDATRPLPGGETIAPAPRTLPANIRVPAALRPALEDALQQSPTLQRQMDLIARTPRFRITIRFGGLRGSFYDALTRFYRHEWGAIVVDVTLYMPGDVVQLVAHELEHVCEQIEGVDLEAASAKGTAVYAVGDRYETERAIAAGRRASREIERGRRRGRGGREGRSARVECADGQERVGSQP